MKPEIEVLGISIKTFGVAFAFGFLACGALVARRLRELGRPVDWAYEITFAALIGGVVGARVYYLIENASKLHGSVIGNVFSGSGLVWYGGAIGGAIGGDRLDALAPRAGTADARHVRDRARARVRDRPHRLPGLRRRRLRHPLDAADLDGLSPRHRADAARSDRAADADLRDGPDVPAGVGRCGSSETACVPGVVFALYLLGSGFERLMIEFIRRNNEVVLGLTAPQIESIVAMAAGLIWLGVLLNRGGWEYLRAPDAPRRRPAERAVTA